MSILSDLLKSAGRKVYNTVDDVAARAVNYADDIAAKAANYADDVARRGSTLNNLLDTVDDAYFTSNFNPTSLTLAKGNAGTDTVATLKKAILGGDDITPIAAIRAGDGKLSVLDGHHRLEAFRQTGRKPIVKEFLPSEKSKAYNFASLYEKSKK